MTVTKIFKPQYLRSFVSVIWWGYISVFAFTSVYVIVNVLLGNYENLSVMFPLRFLTYDIPALDFGNNFVVESLKHVSAEFEISPITFQGFWHPLTLSFGVFVIATIALALWYLTIIKSFLNEIIEMRFFTTNNVRRLLHLGHISLAMTLMTTLYLIFTPMLLNQVGLLSKDVKFDFSYYMGGFIDGAIQIFVFYMFAGIFQHGLQLKEEQDLTI